MTHIPILAQEILRKVGAGTETVTFTLDVSHRLYCIDRITVYDPTTILTLVRIVFRRGSSLYPFDSAVNVGAASIFGTIQRVFLPSPFYTEIWLGGGGAGDIVTCTLFGYATD